MKYSNDAKEVAEVLGKRFPYLEFTIMDFVQLNEFVNHQLAHNVVYVSVEQESWETSFLRHEGKISG